MISSRTLARISDEGLRRDDAVNARAFEHTSTTRDRVESFTPQSSPANHSSSRRLAGIGDPRREAHPALTYPGSGIYVVHTTLLSPPLRRIWKKMIGILHLPWPPDPSLNSPKSRSRGIKCVIRARCSLSTSLDAYFIRGLLVDLEVFVFGI